MINLTLLISALIAVESGGDDAAVGRHGERGALQITARVWRQHTTSPFILAHRREASVRVGERHLRWLVKNGVPETPWELAYAWNSGRTATVRRILGTSYSSVGCSYALRVERTYNSLLAKSKRGSKPSNRP